MQYLFISVIVNKYELINACLLRRYQLDMVQNFTEKYQRDLFVVD